MKEFSDYDVASISEDTRERITNLEKEIAKETGLDVVLIAYQEKENMK